MNCFFFLISLDFPCLRRLFWRRQFYFCRQYYLQKKKKKTNQTENLKVLSRDSKNKKRIPNLATIKQTKYFVTKQNKYKLFQKKSQTIFRAPIE